MGELTVRVVTPDRQLWRGAASFVRLRTVAGQIGILPGHEPMLASLAEGGVIDIRPIDGERLIAAVHGGFVSVDSDTVRILASVAETAAEIDVARVERALERLDAGTADEGEEPTASRRRAEARLRAVNWK
jgi:F-type H+-transporting ATPase subunit epsilon